MPDPFGTLIQELRLKAGYESLGELSRVSGVTSSTLSRIENNKQNPTPATLKKLAPHLKVKYEDLMSAAGYLPESNPDRGTNPDEIREAIKDDPELLEFWKQVERRDELKIFCKQARRLPASDIKLVVDIMRRIEQEEEDE